MGLRRRVADPDYDTIKAIIARELRTSNKLKGPCGITFAKATT